MSEWMSIFQPGLEYVRQQRDLDKILVVEEDQGAPGPARGTSMRGRRSQMKTTTVTPKMIRVIRASLTGIAASGRPAPRSSVLLPAPDDPRRATGPSFPASGRRRITRGGWAPGSLADAEQPPAEGDGSLPRPG